MLDSGVSTGRTCMLCPRPITAIILAEATENSLPVVWGGGFNAEPGGIGVCCYICLIDLVMPARGIPTDSMREEQAAAFEIREELYEQAKGS